MTRHRGFTLLELLLALMITVVIAGTLAASLYIAFRANRSAQGAVESGRLASGVNYILAGDLATALPPNGVLAAEFVGEESSLSFYATAGDGKANPPSDIQRVEYELVADSNSLSTLVRRVDTNLLAQVTPELEDEVICRDVVTFTMRYYDGLSWYDRWDSTENENVLPIAVEVTLELKPTRPNQRELSSVQILRIPCGTTASNSIEISAAGGDAW